MSAAAAAFAWFVAGGITGAISLVVACALVCSRSEAFDCPEVPR